MSQRKCVSHKKTVRTRESVWEPEKEGKTQRRKYEPKKE